MIFWCHDQDCFVPHGVKNCDEKKPEIWKKLLPVVGTNGKPRKQHIFL